MSTINKEKNENKMGVMPINRLIISMSLPIMLSMFVQALYNFVDSIFVSRLGESALTAVTLVFPVQNLMLSVAVGTGIGMNSLLSKSLGEKDIKRANNAANNGIFLAVFGSFIFLILGLLFSRTFFQLQTQDTEIIEQGTSYLTICSVFSVFWFGQITFERLLQSTGKTVYSMITQIIGAVINIILDPIFIFGLFGMPALGVTGAAIATVIGQAAGLGIGIYLNHRYNKEIKISLKGFRPEFKVIKKIYAVGLPSIIMFSIGSIMIFCINNILIKFTETAAMVFGVYFKIQSFIFMPIFGLSYGIIPIVAFNYGAKRKKRIVQSFKYGMLYSIIIMTVGLLIFQFLSVDLLLMFDASDEMLRIGIPALRTLSLGFISAGYCIICSTIFQALGKGILSLATSFLRQLIVLLPLAYLFSFFGNVDMIWWAFVIAEIVSVAMCTFFIKNIYENIIKPM